MAIGRENAVIQANGSPENNFTFEDLPSQPSDQSPSKPWSNPRKRPSIPSHLVDSAQNGLTLSEISNGANAYPQKRSRAADWPLRSTEESDAPSDSLRRSRRSPGSTGKRHTRALRSRSSKFLEGSMNDRVSTKPPSIYTEDEEAMERYHDQSTRDCNDVEEDKAYFDAGIEPTKPSGMYRFGKALSSAFNPVNVWQGINGIWKGKETKSHAEKEKTVLQDRKIRAEKAYAGMKKNGVKGTQPFSTQVASVDQSTIKNRRSHEQSLDSSNRDSGVDMDGGHNSSFMKHTQPTSTGSEDPLIPPTLPAPPATPMGNADGGRRSSLTLGRPSFQSLKKVKSHIQMPSARRKGADGAVLSPDPSNEQSLRRQPSKKDIARQRRLTRQVSNLETKLEAARRELELSQSQVPEVPKIPKSTRQSVKAGRLPSLPSESIINARNASGQDIEPERRASTPRRSLQEAMAPEKSAIKPTLPSTPKANSQSLSTTQPAMPMSSGKKRKSPSGEAEHRNHRPCKRAGDGSDTDGNESGRMVLRSRKSQKLRNASTPNSAEETANQPPVNTSRVTYSLTPKCQAPVPPIPRPAARFDPAKVDQKKLMAMRSVPRDHLPFGSHLDDIVNLQKEFPHCSQKQIDNYLSTLPKAHKSAQEVAMNRQIAVSLLERAAMDSGSKSTEPGKAPASGRQPCKDVTSNKVHFEDSSTFDEAVRVDPSKDKSIPPLPVSPIKMTSQVKKSSHIRFTDVNKPLPDIQKENYNWPEDVF